MRLLVLSLMIGSLALAEVDLENLLSKLVDHPSKTTLKEFSQACKPSTSIQYESNEKTDKVLKKAAESKNLLVIKALLQSINCSSGASAEALKMAIGNETLLRSPALLIQAIYEEKAEKEFGKISQMENDQWFAVECQDPKCRSQKTEFWNNKRTQLEGLKVPKKHESIRKTLVEAIPKEG